MCGISGIVDLNGSKLDLRLNLKKMSDILRHRGPDDEGFFFHNKEQYVTAGGVDTPRECYESDLSYAPDSNTSILGEEKYWLGLAHRRLSIIDLHPTGHQPMCSDDKNLWIVFNGEIYNFVEIRTKLQHLGIRFYSNSDTEVVLKAYQYWGKECVQEFNGMWAFAIYDRSNNTIFCSRDRFGVKPLYYIFNKNVFAFASEQKALVELPFYKKEINNKAAFQYLVLGVSEGNEQGLFEGVIELMPAHELTLDISNKTAKVEQYYQLKYQDQWEDFSESKLKQHVAETKELFIQAVKRRLRSDAPLGSCLSGGLDSSSIVCVTDSLVKSQYMNQVGAKQNVFTATFPNDAIDERKWAQMVVENTNTQWHKTQPTADGLVADFEALTYAQDIPILGFSTYAQYKVMQLVNQKGIKVTLDGQGADELFAGYTPHYSAYFYETILNNNWKQGYANTTQMRNQFANFKDVLTYPIKNLATRFLLNNFDQNRFKKYHHEFGYLSQEFWNTNKHELEALKYRFVPHLNNMLYNQFTGPDLKVLMRTGDRNSMRFSVESRVPFADDLPLIEKIFNIPSSYKIHHNQSKYLLRQAMKDILPSQINNRSDKLGFATPEYNWLISNKDFFKQYLKSDLEQFFDVKTLIKDWDNLMLKIPPQSTQRLFRIVQFSAWKKIFNL